MKFLIFDTTREKLSVSLFNETSIDEMHSDSNFKNHNKNILNFVETLLDRNGINFDEIDCFACNIGPGSFTGIRLGISTVNAFHLATKRPIIGYNIFEPMAYKTKGEKIFALNSIHDKFYYAKYADGIEIEIGETNCKNIENLTPIYINKDKISDNEIIKTVALVIEKYNKREFKTQLCPLYLKQSQAEINFENKNK